MAKGRKIVVIHPPQEVEGDFVDYPHFTNVAVWMVATHLKQQGHFVHLLDAFALEQADVRPVRGGRLLFGVPHVALLERLRDADFDVAVVHVSQFALAAGPVEGLRFVLEKLRQYRPDSLLVGAEMYAGGMHRIDVDEERLREWYPQLDAFVSLEGEETLAQVVTLSRPEQFWYEGKAASVETLEAVMPPDYSLVAMDAYRAFLGRVGRLPKLGLYPVDENTLPVYFSRGCPFMCSFCSNPYRDYRAVGLEVAGRRSQVAGRVGRGERLVVLDDAVNVRKDFSLLVDSLVEAGVRVEFPNGLRADLLSEELVGKLSKVADKITVSAESAAPRVQKDIIGKMVTLDHVRRVAAWCNNAGLPLYIHWMVGLPGEQSAETVQTLEAARDFLDEFGAIPLVQFASGLRPPASGLGQRMQHAPLHIPDGMSREELVGAVKLLRKRAAMSDTAKVIINITYRCNNHCVFCAVGNRIQEDLPLDEVVATLERYRKSGVSMLDLDGGEPTLHADLFSIIEKGVELGYRPINITTNGRRLAYEKFARRLVNSGITSLLFSIHGPTAEIHELNTNAPGSFRETMAGLTNALSLRPDNLDLGVNTTLSVHNYMHLDDLVSLLAGRGVQKINIQYLTPFGRAAQNLVPDPKLASDVVRGVIERWKEKVKLQVVNLPLCYLPGLEDHVGQDLGKLSRNMVFVTREEVNLYKYLAQTRAYDEGCAACAYRVACDGRYDFAEVLP